VTMKLPFPALKTQKYGCLAPENKLPVGKETPQQSWSTSMGKTVRAQKNTPDPTKGHIAGGGPGFEGSVKTRRTETNGYEGESCTKRRVQMGNRGPFLNERTQLAGRFLFTIMVLPNEKVVGGGGRSGVFKKGWLSVKRHRVRTPNGVLGRVILV